MNRLAGKPVLQSRLLLLAAQSPFLGETILKHPEHIAWLERQTEQEIAGVKSTETLSEDLARFVVSKISADRRTNLSRFKRRELLRIYLRDLLGLATLSEITEELSNLADVILSDALAQALQQMANLHGSPLETDNRGRAIDAEMAIVALGKLGCRELNYASDIDLLFLYSGTGATAGDGRRADSSIGNKEFFTGVTEGVVQTIGSSAGEGAVYRIDLRLRPYGRDGDLVWDVARAVDYYTGSAESWERQSLIRARVAAGSERVFSSFINGVRDSVFSTKTRADTFAGVRRLKEKIERKAAERGGGFNVKLGPGGIREIEFIAQALQLEYGGREPWVRSAQTLIVLARLAEKGHLSENERARLSAAYAFLRTVEHRLQMEHGAQTHALPKSHERLEMLARRCGYDGANAAANLLAALAAHTGAVRAVYNRVFGSEPPAPVEPPTEPGAMSSVKDAADDEVSRLLRAARMAVRRLLERGDAQSASESALNRDRILTAIGETLPSAISPVRSLKNLYSWADSLATYPGSLIAKLGEEDVVRVIERLTIVLSSQFLSQILISRPQLAAVLTRDRPPLDREGYVSSLLRPVAAAVSSESRSDALRRAWYEQILEIGLRDMTGLTGGRDESRPPSGKVDLLRQNNLAQTSLAEAALEVATGIAMESLSLSSWFADNRRFTILALGRLGHAGMDYGSDLDLMMIFDDNHPAALSDSRGDRALPEGYSSLQELYSALTSAIVGTLASITREGMIYRVDLRLRPEGKSGPVARGLGSLLSYISTRASAWELSAYLKVREVGGDLSFGAAAGEAIRSAVFDAAARIPELSADLLDIRVRLEREKAKSGKIDLKWGRGGMTDAYFVTRYLQLANRVSFPPGFGTSALIEHLGNAGVMSKDAAGDLTNSYAFLRRLDHWMRLLLDRPTPVLPASSVALKDLAIAMNAGSREELEQAVETHTSAVRRVFNEIFGQTES